MKKSQNTFATKKLVLDVQTIKQLSTKSGIKAGNSQDCLSQGQWKCPSVTHCLTQ